MGWFSKVVDAVKSAVGAAAGAASDTADAVGDAVGDAAGAVADTATGAAGAIRDLGGDAITSLGDAAGKAYDTVTDVGYELLDPGSSIRNAGELGSRIVGATGDITSKAIDETLGASILPDAIETIGDKLADAVDEATELTGDSIEGIAETAGSATDVVRDKTTDGVLFAGDAAGSMWEGTKATAGDAWDAVKDGGRAVGGVAGDAANAVGGAAVDAAQTTGEAVGDGAGAVWDAAGSAWKAVTDDAPDDEKERLEELTDQQARRHVEQSVDMRKSVAQVDIEGQAASDQTDEAAGDYRSSSVADVLDVEEGTRASIEDAVTRGSYESAAASEDGEDGEAGEANTKELMLEGFAAPAEAGTDPRSGPGDGHGRPGAGTRPAATASPGARVNAPDEPPGVEVAAEAQAEGLVQGRLGEGDDDAGDDLAGDFLGRSVQATSDFAEGSRLELADDDIQPRITPFEVGDEAHEISIEHEAGGLFDVEDTLDDIVDEEVDSADDGLDL